MATLPRLPRTEHWALRLACGLPAPLQRLLAGRPTELDGQRLEPDIHMLLRIADLFGRSTVTGGASPERARAENRADTRASGGRPRPMASVEPLRIPGPTGDLRARLYVAPNERGAAPREDSLIVYFHGGGWVLGDLDTHDSTCRFLAAHSGAAVLSTTYRLAPEHPFPAGVEDAAAAFRWAAENAADLGADPERIAVGGDSAGANLAASACLLAREEGGTQPAMQLLIYPVTDADGGQSRITFADGFQLTKMDMDWFEMHYLGDNERDADDPRVSVLRADSLAGLPPAYIATAGFDPLRDEGEAYAERLREFGVPTALRRHPGLIHGFANLTAISRSSRAAMHEAAGAVRMGLAQRVRVYS